MNRTLSCVGALAVLLGSLAPSSTAAQGIGIAARAGTLGVGGDLVIGLGPRISLRGGGSYLPVKPEGTFSDIDFEVELPSPLFTAGLDLELVGPLRLGAGVLVGSEETSISGVFAGTVDIGGRTYTGAQVGTMTGSANSANSVAPYALLGLGATLGTGIGIFLDLGAAYRGETDLVLEADGPIASDAQFQADLERERQEIEDDVGSWTEYYPMINLGLRIGLGG